MPANLVFRLKIWGARDNGIPPRSTPAADHLWQSRLLKLTAKHVAKGAIQVLRNADGVAGTGSVVAGCQIFRKKSITKV